MLKKILESIVKAPAEVLEETVEASENVAKTVTKQKIVKRARTYWRTLGPGLTTGASDDDPSGIATYSQAGSRFGFSLLWTALFTFPLMAVVQEMCARIGMVTGRGLAANIKRHYPGWVLSLCTGLLFGANVFNIGADLGAMAAAGQLLFPKLHFAFLVLIFGVSSLLLQVFISYERYARYLKWLALVLLSYIFSAMNVDIDWGQAIRNTVVPQLSFSAEQIFLVCGILGTTISPYLFFWQTSQEVEEEILEGRTNVKQRQEELTDAEVKSMRVDVWSGMLLSNLVMFFIIATCAATLFAGGITDIRTAADAAAALKPFAGEGAYLLFALGIIGTGMLAVPVLAGSAAYAVSESFGWRQGLYRRLKEASAFYGVIIIAMGLGLGLNFVGFDPMKVLIYSAVLNGLVAPVILVLIVRMSSNPRIMGTRVNSRPVAWIGWGLVAVMVVAGVLTLASL